MEAEIAIGLVSSAGVGHHVWQRRFGESHLALYEVKGFGHNRTAASCLVAVDHRN